MTESNQNDGLSNPIDSTHRAPSASTQPGLILCVFLPFVSGYYLSYLYRTINALISGQLASELNLGPADWRTGCHA
jgi:hypothetical protein